MKETGWLTSIEKEHLTAFVRRFVPKRRQSRWLTILASAPKKWLTLTMDDVFEGLEEHSRSVRLIKLKDVLAGAAGQKLSVARAVMFRLSSKPGVSSGTVGSLLASLSLDDAVISVEPGRLALVAHHSGDWLLCGEVRL
jgi:hypothetical protein